MKSDLNTHTTLAVLIIEDSENDAQLIVRLLKKAGYDIIFERVETAEQMRTELEKHTWDIVISDHSLPGSCRKQDWTFRLSLCRAR